MGSPAWRWGLRSWPLAATSNIRQNRRSLDGRSAAFSSASSRRFAKPHILNTIQTSSAYPFWNNECPLLLCTWNRMWTRSITSARQDAWTLPAIPPPLPPSPRGSCKTHHLVPLSFSAAGRLSFRFCLARSVRAAESLLCQRKAQKRGESYQGIAHTIVQLLASGPSVFLNAWLPIRASRCDGALPGWARCLKSKFIENLQCTAERSSAWPR